MQIGFQGKLSKYILWALQVWILFQILWILSVDKFFNLFQNFVISDIIKFIKIKCKFILWNLSRSEAKYTLKFTYIKHS